MAQLDHEKPDVYQLKLQFVAWAAELIVELCDTFSPSTDMRQEIVW